MNLEDKAVLITGASSGIGWAAAHAFAAEGCKVALTARRADKLEALVKELKARGTPILALPGDARDRASVAAAVEQTAKTWGTIDVLVNNAGILFTGPFESQTPEQFEDLIKTNYLGCVYAIHASLPHMKRQGRGRIVNVASIAGVIGLPYMAAYCASKWALVGLTEALRREYYATGIAFSAFCPGLVATPMASRVLSDPELGPKFRPKTPEQAAAKIVYLAKTGRPELIYGEAPGFMIKLSKFFPGLSDWGVQKSTAGMRKLYQAKIGSPGTSGKV